MGYIDIVGFIPNLRHFPSVLSSNAATEAISIENLFRFRGLSQLNNLRTIELDFTSVNQELGYWASVPYEESKLVQAVKGILHNIRAEPEEEKWLRL